MATNPQALHWDCREFADLGGASHWSIPAAQRSPQNASDYCLFSRVSVFTGLA